MNIQLLATYGESVNGLYNAPDQLYGIFLQKPEILFNPFDASHQTTERFKINGRNTTAYEARFFIRAVVSGSLPEFIPALWGGKFEQVTPAGLDLIENRHKVLSAELFTGMLRQSEINYKNAYQQMQNRASFLMSEALIWQIQILDLLQHNEIFTPILYQRELLQELRHKPGDSVFRRGALLYNDLRLKIEGFKIVWQADQNWLKEWCISAYRDSLNG